MIGYCGYCESAGKDLPINDDDFGLVMLGCAFWFFSIPVLLAYHIGCAMGSKAKANSKKE